MKLKHYSWFRVFFGFFGGGKENFIRLKMQKLRGSFSKFLRDPFLAFGYVFFVFQIIQPLGFWMLMWSTNLLSYLSARTKDCQGQKSQSDEGHESWRNHNLLEDGVMSPGFEDSYGTRANKQRSALESKENMESLHQKLNMHSVDGHLVPVGSVLINSSTF